MIRNIDRSKTTVSNPIKSITDKQIQFSIGYKFTDNLTLDVSRAEINENYSKGGIFGANLNYLYKF